MGHGLTISSLNWLNSRIKLNHVKKGLYLALQLAVLCLLWQFGAAVLAFISPAGPVKAREISIPEAESFRFPLESFAQKINGRGIFFQAKQEAVSLTAEGIAEKTRDLLLTGIVRTGDLEAIFKDKLSNQTYFARQGQKIKDLTVEQITNSSVILRWQNEKKEFFVD